MSSSQPIALLDSDEDGGGGSDLPELTFKSTARQGKSQTVVLSDDDDDDALDGHDSSSSGYAVVATSSRAIAVRPALSSGKQLDVLKLKSKSKQEAPAALPAPPVFAPSATKAAKESKHQARGIVEDSDATDDNARPEAAPLHSSNGKKLRKSGSTRVQTVVTSEDDDSTMDEADRAVPVPAPTAPSSASKNNAPFRERLSRNIDSSPMYSKTFKGKVKGSNSTSIPLNDERFDSGPEDDEYESEGRVSAKKSRRRARSSSKENEDDFIVADDVPIEREHSSRKERTNKGRSPPRRDKGKGKDVARLLEASASSDLPEISDIIGSPGKHSRRNGMEKMQSSRKEKERKERKKEKHRKRVVGSPEPVASSSRGRVVDTDSDDGIRVAHSAQPASKSRKRKRSSTKDATGKKHRPLFIESEDEDAPRQRNASEDEDSPPPAPRRRKSKKYKKKSKKSVHSSDSGSSSNDDSDSPAPPEDSDEDLDEVENLKLDTDQVIQEKLRPKDDSKERRLDKLRLARAAKQRKTENRRRGIVDSDDEDDKRAKVEEISSDEDATDEQAEDVPDLDDDDEDLIDDEDDGEDARRKAERNLPVEFSSHAKQPLEEHFKHFIAHLVYIYVFPKSKTILRDPKRLFSARAIENEITGVVNSAATSSIWQTEFRKALDAKPYMYMEPIHYSPGCNGCNRDRTASQLASISGAPYNRTTWEPLEDADDSDSDAEDPDDELQFNLGRFCAEKAQVAHALMHFAYHTKITVHEKCDKEYRLPRKDKAISSDRDERNRKKDKEAQRILGLIDKGKLSAANAMWDDLKLLLEQGRRIGTSSAWGKYVLDE